MSRVNLLSSYLEYLPFFPLWYLVHANWVSKWIKFFREKKKNFLRKKKREDDGATSGQLPPTHPSGFLFLGNNNFLYCLTHFSFYYLQPKVPDITGNFGNQMSRISMWGTWSLTFQS